MSRRSIWDRLPGMSAAALPVRSPCRRLCHVVEGACPACGRTVPEVQHWLMFTPERRDQIIDQELPLRQQARHAPAPLIGQRLREADASRVLDHLQALSFDDRRSRFGHGMKDQALQRWVDQLDWHGQWLWHPHAQDAPVQALLHLAPAGQPHTWEVGLSVEAALRGQGWGRRLMTHALEQARQFSPGGTVRLQGSALNPALGKLGQAGEARIIDGEWHITFAL